MHQLGHQVAAEVRSHYFGVVHQERRFREHCEIDSLHDVLVAGRGPDQVRLVYVTAAERAHRDNWRRQLESIGDGSHQPAIAHDNALRTAARSSSCVTPKHSSSDVTTRTVPPAATRAATTSGRNTSPSQPSATNTATASARAS